MTSKQSLAALKAARIELETATKTMHYEGGLAVTALDGAEIERMFHGLRAVLQTADEAIRAAERKTYRVTYSVIRSEVYAVEADDEDDAETRAFEEGTRIEDEGETINVTELSTELLDNSENVRYDTLTVEE